MSSDKYYCNTGVYYGYVTNYCGYVTSVMMMNGITNMIYYCM